MARGSPRRGTRAFACACRRRRAGACPRTWHHGRAVRGGGRGGPRPRRQALCPVAGAVGQGRRRRFAHENVVFSCGRDLGAPRPQRHAPCPKSGRPAWTMRRRSGREAMAARFRLSQPVGSTQAWRAACSIAARARPCATARRWRTWSWTAPSAGSSSRAEQGSRRAAPLPAAGAASLEHAAVPSARTWPHPAVATTDRALGVVLVQSEAGLTW